MTEYFVLSGADSPGNPFAVQQPDGPDLYLREADLVDILGFFMTGESLFEDSDLLEGDYQDYALNYYTHITMPAEEPSFEDEVEMYWESTLLMQGADVGHASADDGDMTSTITHAHIMSGFVERFGDQVGDALDIAARLVLERDALPVLPEGYDYLTPDEQANGAPCSRCGKIAEIPDDEHWCRSDHLCDGCYDELNPEPVGLSDLTSVISPYEEEVNKAMHDYPHGSYQERAFLALRGKVSLEEVIDPQTGEVLLEAGQRITSKAADSIITRGFGYEDIRLQEKAK